MPNVAIRIPAMAGPIIRALCTITLFRLTAFTTRSGPTISITKLWRVGLSIAFTAAAHEHEREHHPRLHRPAGGQRPEQQGGQHHRHLGHHQQAPLVEAVGQQAAERAEEQYRDELQAVVTHRHAAVGEGEDQPHLGHDLNPVAAERHDLAHEVAPVVRDGQREEGLAERRSSAPVLEHALEHVGRALERGQVLRRQVTQPPGQIGVLTGAQPFAAARAPPG